MKTIFKKIAVLLGIYVTVDNLITIVCYGDLTFKDMSYSEIKTYVIALISFLFFGYWTITIIFDLIKDNKE